jgi:hypothetical protein
MNERKINPVGSSLRVRPITPPDYTASGLLYLPANRQRENYHRARVEAVGPRVEETINPGDVVWVIGCDAGRELGDGSSMVDESLLMCVEDGEETP